MAGTDEIVNQKTGREYFPGLFCCIQFWVGFPVNPDSIVSYSKDSATFTNSSSLNLLLESW